MVAQAVWPALPILDDFCHGLPGRDCRFAAGDGVIGPEFGRFGVVLGAFGTVFGPVSPSDSLQGKGVLGSFA